jgi:uncharacterized damage-inducible protein DinB
MSNELVTTFRESISAARAKIAQSDDGTASVPVKAGGWNSKQVLGHLIDSALNNHQRFVRASLDGRYEGPSYEQEGWVNLHGYETLPWHELKLHWERQNDLLCAVVERIPESRYGVPCKVGADAPVTLRFLIEDYLTHLHHHLDHMVTAVSAGRLFIEYSLEKMHQMRRQIHDCVESLTDEQIWQRSGDNANSIGNLLLHLSGNVRQWIGHGVGGLADVRERDKEFAARGGRSTAEVLGLFEKTIQEATSILEGMPLERLTERTKPQSRDVAILEAIYQVVGHLQLHAGQIIFATKQITGKDLGFFKP